jgi:hypothetical protein
VKNWTIKICLSFLILPFVNLSVLICVSSSSTTMNNHELASCLQQFVTSVFCDLCAVVNQCASWDSRCAKKLLMMRGKLSSNYRIGITLLYTMYSLLFVFLSMLLCFSVTPLWLFLLVMVGISSVAHPVSYPMGTQGSFPGGKVAGAWSWPLTSN